MRRRQFLATTGIAAVTTLAGCSGSEDGSSDGGESGGNGSSGSSNGSGNSSGGTSNESNGGNESGSSSSDDAEEALTDDDQESTVDGLEITEHELVEGDYSVSVQGVVLNDTGDELGYVEVGVVTYNADGQRIGDSFTNTTDLPTGEEWAFEVPLTSDADEIEEYTIAVTDSPF